MTPMECIICLKNFPDFVSVIAVDVFNAAQENTFQNRMFLVNSCEANAPSINFILFKLSRKNATYHEQAMTIPFSPQCKPCVSTRVVLKISVITAMGQSADLIVSCYSTYTLEEMESVWYIIDIANQGVLGAALFCISSRSAGKSGNISSVVGHCIL
jgi:hypothetical protein